MTYRITSLLLVTTLITSAASAMAAVPALLQYQGQLQDEQGEPLTGNFVMLFSIYAEAQGGDALWSEVRQVEVINGLFTVELGQNPSIDPSLFDGTDRFLGVSVENDPEMEPRLRFLATPYALRVGSIEGALGGRLSGWLSIGGPEVLAPLTVRETGVSTGGIDPYADVVALFTQTGANGNSAISIMGENGQNAILYFANGPKAAWGIQYDAANGDQFQIQRIDMETGESISSLVIDTLGRVGIGTIQPQASLHIEGDILLGPTQRYYSIPAVGFMPGSDEIGYSHIVASPLFRNAAVGTTPGQSVIFNAPVHLPHGATVTAVRAEMYDDGYERMRLHMFRDPYTDMAELSSSKDSSFQWYVTSTITEPVIDNLNYSYGIKVSWSVSNNPLDVFNMALSHVVVEYTVESPLP